MSQNTDPTEEQHEEESSKAEMTIKGRASKRGLPLSRRTTLQLAGAAGAAGMLSSPSGAREAEAALGGLEGANLSTTEELLDSKAPADHGNDAHQPEFALLEEEIESPSGIIAMYEGTGSSIPSGWRLCDGSGGTPDLRNRFVVAAGREYDIGDTGGSNEHQLTVSEMPRHRHNYRRQRNSRRGRNRNTNRPRFERNRNTNNTGGDQPHENRPPYYALAYIQKE